MVSLFPSYVVCVGEILATKTKEDTEKRKQLRELKAEMERETKVFILSFVCSFYLFTALFDTALCRLTTEST